MDESGNKESEGLYGCDEDGAVVHGDHSKVAKKIKIKTARIFLAMAMKKTKSKVRKERLNNLFLLKPKLKDFLGVIP